MTDTRDIAREAIELAEKATPGPWGGSNLDERVIAGPDVGGDPLLIALVKDSSRAMHHYGEHCVPSKATGKANARFIGFAREALPILARSLLELTEENERLKDEWSVMARACGNWREWGDRPETDHDHPDWKVAARAIVERDSWRNNYERICPTLQRQSDAYRETLSEVSRLRGLVRVLLDNEPDDTVADGGITVLMAWRKEARELLRAAATSLRMQEGLLWCCHVRGPDDVIPTTDYASALKMADEINNHIRATEDARARLEAIAKQEPDQNWPKISAVPAPWPWSAEAHAKGLSAVTLPTTGDDLGRKK